MCKTDIARAGELQEICLIRLDMKISFRIARGILLFVWKCVILHDYATLRFVMKVSLKPLLVAIAATVALTACTKDPAVERNFSDIQPEGTRVIAVSFAPQTRTTLENDLKPKFNDGDSILISNGETLDTCEVSVEGDKATISTDLTGPLTAVYPAKAAKMENENEIAGVLVSAEQDGTFAHANIAMAENITDAAATFSNWTTLFIVSVPEAADTLVVISRPTPGEETEERIGEAVPINTEEGEASLKVTVTAKDTDDKFYVSLSPGANLSDLLFEAGGKSKEISVDAIEEAGASNELIAGSAYVINSENWNSVSEDSTEDENSAPKEDNAGKNAVGGVVVYEKSGLKQ